MKIEAISSKSFNIWNSIINKKTGYDRACSVCSETTRVAKTSIPCGNCKHLIHKKCAQLDTFSINNIISHLISWECGSCTTKYLSVLPFEELEEQEIVDLSFNSNFNCKCNSTAISLTKYNNLEQLETCKISLKEYDSLYNSDSDSNLTDFSNFNYFDNHEFHKLSKKPSFNFKVKQKIGILHTNICSISKNLENLQILTSNLDYNFDIIAVSETWHTIKNDSDVKKLKLEGYHDYVKRF